MTSGSLNLPEDRTPSVLVSTLQNLSPSPSLTADQNKLECWPVPSFFLLNGHPRVKH
jgi:hypothetical protein